VTPAGDPIDDLTRWLGMRWESAERVRLTIRPELINGLLAGPVAYAMVDYSMGSALWQRSEVRHEDGRLLATAIGSFAIFPRERLGGHERGPASPGSR
jgi:acyl-coenzyme A thioesterase PaaI-like protein